MLLLLIRRRPFATVATALAACAVGLPVTACGPRAVNVASTAPAPAGAGLNFTNRTNTAVNVYVRGPSGDEIFVRQVPAGGNESLVVRGISPGATVSLRAAPVNGTRGFSRENVTLGTGASWTVP